MSVSTRGETRMQWSDGSYKLDLTLHGTVAFTDDLTDVASLSDGGRLTIRTWKGVVPRRGG